MCTKNKERVMMQTTRLKHKRVAQGMTQVAVATKAEVALRAYKYYEAGERTPNAITAKRIAQALHSTVEELF